MTSETQTENITLADFLRDLGATPILDWSELETYPLPAKFVGSYDYADNAFLPTPDDEASYGDYSIKRYNLVDGRWLRIDRDEDYTVSVEESTRNIADALLDWPWDDMGWQSSAEFLGAFGIDPMYVLEKADETWTGHCKVLHEPQYYGGSCNAPTPSFALGDDSPDDFEFADYAAAKAYVDNYYTAPGTYDGIPACNELAHNQAGPDTLTIVRA